MNNAISNTKHTAKVSFFGWAQLKAFAIHNLGCSLTLVALFISPP